MRRALKTMVVILATSTGTGLAAGSNARTDSIYWVLANRAGATFVDADTITRQGTNTVYAKTILVFHQELNGVKLLEIYTTYHCDTGSESIQKVVALKRDRTLISTETKGDSYSPSLWSDGTAILRSICAPEADWRSRGMILIHEDPVTFSDRVDASLKRR